MGLIMTSLSSTHIKQGRQQCKGLTLMKEQGLQQTTAITASFNELTDGITSRTSSGEGAQVVMEHKGLGSQTRTTIFVANLTLE